MKHSKVRVFVVMMVWSLALSALAAKSHATDKGKEGGNGTPTGPKSYKPFTSIQGKGY